MKDADRVRGLRQRSVHVRDRSRLTLAALAAAAIACCLALAPAAAARPASACTNAGTPVGAVSHRVLDGAVACLVNQQRRRHGLPGLHVSQELNRSAQGWTNFMVRHNAFFHGSNWAARITAVGFHWVSAGENIAAGYSTPSQVVNAWMGSAGHCRNILAPVFSSMGTGVDPEGTGRMHNMGTWTQDFGLRRGQNAPSRNWGPANGCPY